MPNLQVHETRRRLPHEQWKAAPTRPKSAALVMPCGPILTRQAVAALLEKAHADSPLGVGGGNSGSLVTGNNGAPQAGEINKSWRKYHGR